MESRPHGDFIGIRQGRRFHDRAEIQNGNAVSFCTGDGHENIVRAVLNQGVVIRRQRKRKRDAVAQHAEPAVEDIHAVG